MLLANHPWVRLGKVSFGRAVFARQDIPAGIVIGPVEGRVIDDPAYRSAHCIDLGHDQLLEPRAPFRFLNHCCTPNCRLRVEDVDEDELALFAERGQASRGLGANPLSASPARVWLESIYPVPKGAELTIDYHWSAAAAIKCLCGSPACRGWIVAEEELGRLLELKRCPTKKVR